MARSPRFPRSSGGLTPEASEAASALFRTLGPDKVIHVTDPTSAELAKLFTNVYRYVNFALANEYALLGRALRRRSPTDHQMVNADYPRATSRAPARRAARACPRTATSWSRS